MSKSNISNSTSIEHGHGSTRLRACFSILCWGLVIIVATAGVGELYLRFRGYELAYTVTDPVLGWTSNYVSMQSTENPDVVEHSWPNKQRVSRREQKQERSQRAAVFGDSWTYGAGVRDQDTYVWKLNEMLPDITFDNFGVGGYGTYQCYLRMRDILAREKYDYVILSIWHGQLERSVSGSHLRQTSAFQPAPWIELRHKILVEHAPDIGWEITRQSCLLSFFKRVIYGITFSDEPLEKDDYYRQVFTLLLEYMDKVAQQHNSTFICFLLDAPRASYLSDQSPPLVNIADISIEELQDVNNTRFRVCHTKAYHPNEDAHALWAERIASYFKAHSWTSSPNKALTSQ